MVAVGKPSVNSPLQKGHLGSTLATRAKVSCRNLPDPQDGSIIAAWSPSLRQTIFPYGREGLPAGRTWQRNGCARRKVAWLADGSSGTRFPAWHQKCDLLLADFSQVGCAYKEMDGAASSSLYFNLDQTSFRYVFRVATASLWTSPWTRADNTNASPFVVLSSLSS